MAMVNPAVLSLAAAGNVKDSRWLTLEVCREFQRSKCTRSDAECKFAHPPPHVEVQNGRVTACFDSIKGKCQRKEPPCKYLHPPQHLREQLLQNGRNNLILRNLQVQAAQQAALNQSIVSGGLIPIGHPYLGGAPTPTSAVAFNPYLNTSMPTIAAVNGGAQMNGESQSLMSQHHPGVIPTAVNPASAKLQRPDRLEPQVVEVLTGKKRPRDPSEDLVLSQLPGMVSQYKRLAVPDAKGLPTVYQPISNISYQQALMQMQPQQYIPVSFAGHPPSVQRF